jgi:hypothetical protein
MGEVNPSTWECAGRCIEALLAVGCAANTGCAMADSGKGLYEHLYDRFFRGRESAKGYDFQHQTAGNVPPPPVTFHQQLRWWTWDRWKRRKLLREARDRRVQEIVQLRTPPPKS